MDRRQFLSGAGACLFASGAAPITDFGASPAAAATSLPPESAVTQLPRARVLDQTAIPVYGYEVVKTYPHDPGAYTEGLLKVGGSIYEGTGLYGRSKLMEWDLKSGRILRQIDLQRQIFGEGVTLLNGEIFQLTYLDNLVYVYDSKTFTQTREMRYDSQGWGLTHDGTHLIMSDGSSSIAFRDPATFKPVRGFSVSDAVGPVGFLNELEYADGKLYANVWQSNFIAIIDPLMGKLIGWIDLAGLNPDPKTLVYPYVLNGIAYDTETRNLLVTGKCWPHVWEIALVPRAGSASSH